MVFNVDAASLLPETFATYRKARASDRENDAVQHSNHYGDMPADRMRIPREHCDAS